jgi:hypothetical protein
VPPLPGAVALIGIVGALIALALVIPAEPFGPRQRRTPPPLAFALVGGIGMTLIMVGTYIVPEFSFRPPVTITFFTLVFLVVAEFVILTTMNHGGAGWTDRHRLALVIGYLAFFLVFGIGQDLESFTGRSLVSFVAIFQLRRWWLDLRAHGTINRQVRLAFPRKPH